jgi:acyl-CoA reductase-like NAD-dependent aldehyde dehydrogenase
VDKSIKSEFIDEWRPAPGRWRRAIRSIEDAARGDLVEEATRHRPALHRDCQAGGAQLVAGGARADIGTGRGYFLQPTIFDGVTPEMTIARERSSGRCSPRSSSPTSTKRSRAPTIRTTAWPPRSGRRT